MSAKAILFGGTEPVNNLIRIAALGGLVWFFVFRQPPKKKPSVNNGPMPNLVSLVETSSYVVEDKELQRRAGVRT